MENVNKYQLIHIDTLEVTMCEKYTFGGHDYYIKENYQFRGGAAEHLYHIMLNAVATNNQDTGRPQVVDYVGELANERFGACRRVGFKAQKFKYSNKVK